MIGSGPVSSRMKAARKMVAFQFTETWKATEIQPWIEAIGGMIQVDDYRGYSATVESIVETGKLVTLVPDGVRSDGSRCRGSTTRINCEDAVESRGSQCS